MAVAVGTQTRVQYILPYNYQIKGLTSVYYQNKLSNKAKLKLKVYDLYKNEGFTMNQIWIGLIYYLLLTHIKSQCSYSYSRLELTRMLSSLLFQRIPLINLMKADFKSFKKVNLVSTDQLSFNTS